MNKLSIHDWKDQLRAWPVVVGIALLLTGLGLSAASLAIAEKASANIALTDQLRTRPKGELLQPAATTAPLLSGWGLRPFHLHLDDVGEFARVAGRHNLQLGPAAYRMDHHGTLPLATRFLDVQAEAAYPDLKAFVADLLQFMPHAYLEEIRIEQESDPAAARVKASMRFAFVYEKPAGGTTIARVRARAS